MATDLQTSQFHGIPILLNVDNTLTVTLEHFPALLANQMSICTSDQQEKNLSLEDLCKAASSDLVASNEKANESNLSTAAFPPSTSNLQLNSAITGFVSNIGLNADEVISTESRRIQFCVKDNKNERYKCDYCGKICAKRSILEKHLRAHTNERPYPCEECGAYFKTKSNLYKHCKSKSHLIQTAQASIQKNNGDGNLEKVTSSMKMSLCNMTNSNNNTNNNVINKYDTHENNSSSCDGQDDQVATKTQSPVFLLNQLGNGHVILKPLSQVGINPSAFTSSVASSLSLHNLSTGCLFDSRSNCQRPFLKSFSEKGPSKVGHDVKPHSQSFSNELDITQIPKFDKAMTNDDIQRRISMIISQNDHIIDIPKEIKNHRFRKIVRDFSDSVSQDSCNGKVGTRSNSVTPTFTSCDSFPTFRQISVNSSSTKTLPTQQSNLLSTHIFDRPHSPALTGSFSDSRSSVASQKYSLAPSKNQDQNEFGISAKPFVYSQSILMSKSDSNIKATSTALGQLFSNFCSTAINKSSVDVDNHCPSSKFTDDKSFQSSAISPPSSPIQSMIQTSKLRRGRPRGSKNKSKSSPISVSSSIPSIIPSIHITSVEDQPPESHWREELKRHLMKRSMSNENSTEKEQHLPAQSSACTHITPASCSSLVPCDSMTHLSPSSIPIKKRRKTLTELGRGTAFGTTVDDHNLDLNTVPRSKHLVKPLWSSDGSFGKTFVPDDCPEVNLSHKEKQKLSESTLPDLKESNAEQQAPQNIFINASHQDSFPPKSLPLDSLAFSNVKESYSFITLGDAQSRTSDSNLLSLNFCKEKCLLIPTHYINPSPQYLANSENNVLTNIPALLSVPSNQDLELSRFTAPSSSETSFPDIIGVGGISIPDGEKTANVQNMESSSNPDEVGDESNKIKLPINIMHLKFKGRAWHPVRQGKTSNTMSNSSSIIEFSKEIHSDVVTPLSSSHIPLADDCLIRAQLDSEAAASLLDLSKSRQPTSDHVHFGQEECDLVNSNLISPSKIELSTSIAAVLPVTSTSAFPQKHLSPSNLIQTNSNQFYNKGSSEGHSFATNSKNMKSYSFIENKHICNICQKIFPKEHFLILHKNLHYMEKPFRCGKCQATFQSNWLLKRHQNIAHHHLSKSLYDPRPYKCIECKVAFRTRGHLAKHVRSKLHSQKLSSRFKGKKFCSDSSNSERETYKDMDGTSGIRVVSFNSTTKNGQYFLGDNNSLDNTDNDSAVSQDHCNNAQFDEEPHSTESDSKIENTGHCIINKNCTEMPTSKADSLRCFEGKHKKLSAIGRSRHHEVGDFEVKISCNQNEPTESHMNTGKSNFKIGHLEGSINDGRASSIEDYMMFCCRVCSAIFKDPPSLLLHYEGHLEKRVHVCMVCDAGFKTLASLRTHLNLHAEKKSRGIQTCDYDISLSLQKDGKPVAKNFISNAHSALGELPNAILPLSIFQKCQPNITNIDGADKSGLHISSDDCHGIVPYSSDKSIINSGQISCQWTQTSFQQMAKQNHHDTLTWNDVAHDKVLPASNEVLSTQNSSSQLLLQSVCTNDISLLHQNTYFLVPSEANGDETSSKPQEVFLYNPSAGYFLVASGRSSIDPLPQAAKSPSSLS